jgi:hypothetical protein
MSKPYDQSCDWIRDPAMRADCHRIKKTAPLRERPLVRWTEGGRADWSAYRSCDDIRSLDWRARCHRDRGTISDPRRSVAQRVPYARKTPVPRVPRTVAADWSGVGDDCEKIPDDDYRAACFQAKGRTEIPFVAPRTGVRRDWDRHTGPCDDFKALPVFWRECEEHRRRER